MKELTYEDWQKNPTPRMMWVWDDKVGDKVKRKVIYFNENKHAHYPIIALTSDGNTPVGYKRCAEIEKQRRMTNKELARWLREKRCAEIEKQRRMTNKELARWLREKPTRECKNCNGRYDNFIYCYHTYLERCANEEVDDLILIREDDSDWREPLVEVADEH